jgi:hypothetical protein
MSASEQHLYLISAMSGDSVPGIDIALVPEITALQAPAVREWMAAQGYGPGDEYELMYVADEPGPDGFESLRIDVTPGELATWQAAADEQAASTQEGQP